MSITLAQSPVTNVSASTTQLNLTLGSTGTNGNGIVVVVGSSSAAPSSVTDDAGNTYTRRRTANFFSAPFCEIWDCSSISNSPTVIHVNFAAGRQCQATAYEVLGTITAHAGNQSNANTTTAAAGAFSTTTADTIVFAALKDNTVNSQPSGYTQDSNTNNFSAAHNVYTTTQSSINPTWSNTSGGTACCIEAYTSTNTGGTIYNKSVSSTLTLTESQTPGHVAPRSLTSTLTFTESQSGQNNYAPSVNSTLTLTETVARNIVSNQSVTSTLTLTESQTWKQVYNRSVSETLTLTETQSPTGIVLRTVPETLTFTQTVGLNTVLGGRLAQGLNFSNLPSTNHVANREVDSTLTFTDHIAKAIQVSVTNTLTFTGTAFPINLYVNLIDNSIVQQTPIASTGSNGGTLTLTFPTATRNNDGIVILVGNESSSGTTITSITDDAGNAYTLQQDANNLGTPRSRIYYSASANAANVITIHMSTTGNQVAALAYEVAGSITPDTGSTGTANSTTQQPGAITTASSTIVFALDTAFNVTAPSGWVDDGTAQGVRFIHQIYSSVQTGLNPAFSGLSRFAAAIESFTTNNRGGVHSTLAFTSTASCTKVSSQFLQQTLPIHQPNRIPLNYILLRSVSQNVTFSETETGVASKPVNSTLTFSQTQTADKIKTVTSHLDLGQVIQVSLVLNKTLITLFEPFQTVTPGPNIIHLTVPQTLTLTESATGVDVKAVSQHLTFSQTIDENVSKAVKSNLVLSQAVRLNRSFGLAVSNHLGLSQAVKLNKAKAVSVHHAFGFNGFQKATKSHSLTVSSSLAFFEEVTRERFSRTVAETLTLTQSIAKTKLSVLTVTSHFVPVSTVSMTRSVKGIVTSQLVFLPTHNRMLGDLVFQQPNTQVVLAEPFTLLRAADQVVVLPNPQMGDGEGNTGEFTVRYSINGKTYTYVRNNNTSKLNYSFWLSRRKCRELQRFLSLYQAELVELQNWKGEIWKVYVTNNPFEASSQSQYSSGRPDNEERWDISLEFEGVRMN